MRPIALKIIPKKRKIVYMCAKCGASFENKENIEKCYSCYEPINWENVHLFIPNCFENSNLKDYMEHQKIINFVNKK